MAAAPRAPVATTSPSPAKKARTRPPAKSVVTTAAADKKPVVRRGVGGVESVGATVPDEGKMMAGMLSAEVPFSQMTASMSPVADQGNSYVAGANIAPALAPPALCTPVGIVSSVRGLSQPPLPVGAGGAAGELELDTTKTLGGAASDEMRMAIIGRVRGLCAELLRLSRPNGVVSIYLAIEAVAQEPDLDSITTFINCANETKTPEQSDAFLRRCGGDLVGASGKDKVEVKVPPDGGGSSGDRSGGAKSNKSAEGEGGGNDTPTPPPPNVGNVSPKLDVHPPDSLEALSVKEGEPLHVTDTMIDAFLELTGFANLDNMKQRHLRGVFGVVRKAMIAQTGEGMLPWAQVCPVGLLRKRWKAPGVTEFIDELCLLPPNHPNNTNGIELKRYAVVIACHLSKGWADLVSVYIT